MEFVGHGGLAGRTRAVQVLGQIVTAEKRMTASEAVVIPFFTKYIDDRGIFHPSEEMEQSAKIMLKELLVWHTG